MSTINKLAIHSAISSILLTFFLTVCQGQDNAVPKDTLQFYFPLEVFKHTSAYDGYDTFVDTWYSKHLRAMKEPVVYKDNSQNEIYRFTWLRTFHHPIAVRIEKQENTYMLFWKMCDGAGGYEPGKLIVDKQKEIDEHIWGEFKNRLDQIDFWNLNTVAYDFGLDGSQWILEGKNGKNKYHVVDRWTPDKKTAYYQCCDFLVGLTDLKIRRGDKY